MTEECPLRLWLDKHEESVTEFCARLREQRPPGVSHGTLYGIMNGGKRDLTITTMQMIEFGTGGEVTYRMMTDWFNTLARKASA